MKNKLWSFLALTAFCAAASGCSPLILGAAGAVVVDEAMEQERGGDGLF